MSRVVTLPDEGVLLAATDLHGNLADFRALAARFVALTDTEPVPPRLVICGDLVHGPAIAAPDWPRHLGDYYTDRSRELLDEARRLQQRFPGQVHYLLGNHEHAHLGGPRLSKFHDDEAGHLEGSWGPGEFAGVRRWLSGWPLAAYAARARLALTHAAPAARITSAADLEAVRLDGHETTPLHEMIGSGPLGALLWARTTTAERAYGFLRALHPRCRVAVFGHDIIREGHLIEHEPLLCVSTSFGCHDGDKVYLEWDLATPAEDAHTLARTGLRLLYPDAPPVHRARALT
ncbi:metallophosphoesterase [Actinomadura scrupuli]|uniref:metallophosphoesterase n=1 Tax=Actinomadura scrupuli TaxID=559629 RepID=UPI003D959E88